MSNQRSLLVSDPDRLLAPHRILLHPQLGFSLAIRVTSVAIASLIGGRPGMFG